MIGIILDDNAFEQDIRELLMAFYPGETYIHEEVDGEEMPRLSVYGKTGENRYFLTVREYVEDGEILESEAAVEADYSNRFETKNRIKRMLYGMLSEKTKKELPWGTLTGIRPTKIAMTKLTEGKGEDEIRSYMKETYLTSDAKIDLSIEIAERERELLSAID